MKKYKVFMTYFEEAVDEAELADKINDIASGFEIAGQSTYEELK